jgi:hypothetical protein
MISDSRAKPTIDTKNTKYIQGRTKVEQGHKVGTQGEDEGARDRLVE